MRWLVLGVAVALLGLAGYRAASVLRQRHVVEALLQRPTAKVSYGPPRWEELAEKVPVRWFRWLGKDWFLTPKEVSASTPEVSNLEATLASQLPALRVVRLMDLTESSVCGMPDFDYRGVDRQRLPHSRLDDEGARALRSLGQLEILDLRGARITDAGLRHLVEIRSLRRLCLRRTDITDAGGVLLAGLPELEVLDVAWTEIGDETLLALAKSPTLRQLETTGTRVTQACSCRVRELRPDLEIDGLRGPYPMIEPDPSVNHEAEARDR